jgi:Skp family chaperone for outer membrane proteins
MKPLRPVTLGVTLILALASAAFAQTPPKPVEPAPPSGTAQAPAPARPGPPVALFPAEAKFAFVDFQRVAGSSAAGQRATRTLQDLREKKVAEIQGQNKQLQTLTSQRSAGVVRGPALAQISKDIDKLQRDIQFSQQNAQAELQQLQNDLQGGFQDKVRPVIAAIAQEKGLFAVFTADSGLFYLLPALDISDEVIKRLDAQPAK